MNSILKDLHLERKKREEENIKNFKKMRLNDTKPVIIICSISKHLQQQLIGNLSNYPLTQPAVINNKGEFIIQPIGQLNVSGEDIEGGCFFVHNVSAKKIFGTSIHIDETVTILLDGYSDEIYSEYFYESIVKLVQGRKCKIGLWLTKYCGIGLDRKKYDETINGFIKKHPNFIKSNIVFDTEYCQYNSALPQLAYFLKKGKESSEKCFDKKIMVENTLEEMFWIAIMNNYEGIPNKSNTNYLNIIYFEMEWCKVKKQYNNKDLIEQYGLPYEKDMDVLNWMTQRNNKIKIEGKRIHIINFIVPENDPYNQLSAKGIPEDRFVEYLYKKYHQKSVF